ncbi:hypothetical protein SERLA73DRAFT_52878 [Serpula lacrymans var. lacrymans S7.3]|uniref:Major facilitator superfamily (MFS) profile domain-containing protein n=1 Tax=Serpula lacrymans var. lacrymans (strain S7.3) TaxID=936435 RepID=F8PVP8_SERL3|nr:hypothetical protein SERLA73DRAFT_52878 [Serpula lacrymans var. lacrymans S7.3]
MLGFVCFLCPGMFSALVGLGGGGQYNTKTAANSICAMYSTFAFFSFFTGSVNNKLGPRLTLVIGACGYSLYTASSLTVYIYPDAGDFVTTASVILGICASLLWAAQGSLVLAYPTEVQKGRFIAIFWATYNLGAVVGASISFGINSHSEAFGSGTYIGFLVLTLIGVCIPFFMADPNKMIRTDGTKVARVQHPTWKHEFYSLYVTLKTDPFIVLLFPMFFASNYFYTWQFDDYSAALFNIRTRSLNNLVYWSCQIFGSIAIGLVLDTPRLRRRVRAFSGWAILLAMVFGVYGWAYYYQKGYTRAMATPTMDFSDKGYAAYCWLIIFYGLFGAMWETMAYWLMGAMSNDPAKLAVFSGFYKSILSAGAAVVWRADAMKLPFMNIFASTWALTAAGLVIALPMVCMRIRDSSEEDDQI